MRIIYVNSTVRARQKMRRDGIISPVHYWGYVPEADDQLYCHRINRYEIVLRSKMHGLDPSLALRAVADLARGYRGIYLVTQPDLLVGIPALKKLFPRKPIVTWVWTPEEVRESKRHYSAADHVFCLTEPALEEIERQGFGSRGSVQYWGCNPSYYNLRGEKPPRDRDVVLIGIFGRDSALVSGLAGKTSFNLTTTKTAAGAMKLSSLPGLDVVEEIQSDEALIHFLYSAKLAWIPLKAGDKNPTGYTNLIEALLCGTGVVIAESSTIPRPVLELFGVYLYRTGSEESLRSVTEQALRDAAIPGFHERVRESASKLLDAGALNRKIRELFGDREGKS
jgi:hypothetical protein